MKKFVLSCLIFLIALPGLRAQDGNRLEALKIAYITRKLNLTPEEAQRFWPIYNRYSEDLRNARLDARNGGKSEIELEESVLNIRKRYNASFVTALSPEKADIFFRSEKEFGAFVQKEMERRELRQQRRANMK